MLCVQGQVALFLGMEYQAQSAPNAGTVRGGNPAGDPAFSSWLATAGLGVGDVSSSLGSGPRAVWGKFSTAASNVSSYNYALGSSSVTASISGWNTVTNAQQVSGSASLSTFGNNGSSMQAGSPRPGFASGAGSGYYLGTEGGATSDDVRNGVSFDLSSFAGGGVYSFGIFGGDLETGGPGSPFGFLRVTFLDDSYEDIIYAPDPTLFVDTVYTGNNNISETFGNETSRFIGISSADKRIKSALFVVGDDDKNDNGDSEQLSFIGSGITFLNADGTPYQPQSVPEPATLLFSCAGLTGLVLRRKRASGAKL